MVKILHVITNYAGMGGAERMLSRLIESLPEAEHHIVSLMQISDLYLTSLQCCKTSRALGWRLINTPLTVVKLKKIIEEIQPDVIQSWMYHANVLSTLANSSEAALVWGIHHSLTSIKEESLSTKIALKASRFISNCPDSILFCAESARIQHQSFGFKNNNNIVIPNGIPIREFSSEKIIHSEQTIVGFAGRYHEAKGFPYLFEAIALVQQKNKTIIFKLAGRDVSTKNQEITQLIADNNIETSRVTLCDQVADMPSFYNGIDLFVLSSITEGFPNVLVEAMASGVPCVTTNVGDAAAIVRDAGLVVESKNAVALADAILDYAAFPIEDKQSMSIKCREIIQQNYELNSVAQMYFSIWTQAKLLKDTSRKCQKVKKSH